MRMGFEEVTIVGATTQTGIAVTGDSLTTGKLVQFISNSASASARNLVEIVNSNSLASAAVSLLVEQNANALGVYIRGLSEAKTFGGYGLLRIVDDVLTTGGLAYLSSASASASTRVLFNIYNSNASAIGTTLFQLQSMGGKAMNISHYNSTYAMEITGGAGSEASILLQVDTDVTTTGMLAYFYSNSTSASTRDEVAIRNNQSAAVGTTCLHISQSGTGASVGMQVDTLCTTGYGLSVIGSLLTTGSLGYFYSNSTTSDIRALVKIINDADQATGANCLNIQQDANAKGIYIDSNGNSSALYIDAENTSLNSFQIFSDVLTAGKLALLSSDSADTTGRSLVNIVNDNTLATGAICLDIQQDSNQRAIQIYNAGVTTGYIVAITSANALTTGSIAYFRSNSASTSSRNLVDIYNENAAAVGTTCLSITQSGSGASVGVSITIAATTGCGLSIGGDALTTGQLASFYSNGTDTNARNLVQIWNDNTAAVGAICLYLRNDRTGSGQAIQIVDGNQGAGKVLTSDANGVATWAAASGGKFVGSAYAEIATVITCNTLIPNDDTIPQSNEGNEVITCNYTPISATNKLLITVTVSGTSTGLDLTCVALFKDADAGAMDCKAQGYDTWKTIPLQYEMTSGTTSQITFRVRVGDHQNIFYVNGDGSGNRKFGGIMKANISIIEIAP